MYFLLFCDLRGHVWWFYCLKWPLGPQGFSTLNFESYSVWYSRGSQMGMFLTFSKNPRWYTEKKGNQDPKICILVLVIGIIIYWLWYRGICILVSDMCIFRLGVYEVNCVPCYILFVYFFVGSGVGCVPSICILGFILFWEVIDYILGLCTQKYLEFSGL